MSDAIADFFRKLQGYQPMLPPSSRATMQVNLRRPDGQTEHRYLEFEARSVRVTRDVASADAVLSVDIETFDRVARGGNIIAALLRNDILLNGDLRVLALLMKLIPSPVDAHDPRAFVAERRR